MTESILQLSSRSVRTIMTSRQELDWVDESMSGQEAIDRIARSPCSKLIVTSAIAFLPGLPQTIPTEMAFLP